ncbi:MAG TPA: hypothetical protein VHF67_03050 [Gaiellaceae bacterium]|nr:hypothetical protein [Gaiellaceae bacterium]
MAAPATPLPLGEVLAETVRFYGERFWAAAGLGAVVVGAFALVVLVGGGVQGIAILAVTFTAVYAASARLVGGDAFGDAWAQTAGRVPVLLVLAVVVCVPLALGMSGDPILILFSAFWLAFAGFAVPVAVLEQSEAGQSWLQRLGHAMSRSLELARASYVHAAGVVAALLVIYHLLGLVLAQALSGFAENVGLGGFLLTQLVLAPFFFLGLAVLYFEQNARALSSRRL